MSKKLKPLSGAEIDARIRYWKGRTAKDVQTHHQADIEGALRHLKAERAESAKWKRRYEQEHLLPLLELFALEDGETGAMACIFSNESYQYVHISASSRLSLNVPKSIGLTRFKEFVELGWFAQTRTVPEHYTLTDAGRQAYEVMKDTGEVV